MIHHLLKLDRPLFFFDLETTSLQTEEARIFQIAFVEFRPDGTSREWSTTLNPVVPIPPQITKKTGKTNFDLNARPVFKQLAPYLVVGFKDCDYAGNNIRYDLRVLSAEMQRAGVAWDYRDARVLCTYRLEQIAVPRKLENLYERYTGKKLEQAHDALADIKATVEVFAAQLERWTPLFPRDVAQLHQVQWPDWIDTEGKFRFDEDGVPTVGFGKHSGTPMVEVPGDYWDWMLNPKQDFSAEVRQIVTKAKLGEFPKKG